MAAIARITVRHEGNITPDKLMTELIKDINELEEERIKIRKQMSEDLDEIKNKMYEDFGNLRDRVAKLERGK